ncbi:hypothetical protein EXS74_03515, partial [Candidatus Woesearchaeota archaeon]|nr:hypothetical protein [Candidatus Woesearchaeota archaeon]
MGFFNWLKGLFSKEQDLYTGRKILSYITNNPQRYPIAKADREDMKDAILDIAQEEIQKRGRNLTEEEANIVIRRAQIRISGEVKKTDRAQKATPTNIERKNEALLKLEREKQKEWERIRPQILEFYSELDKILRILTSSLKNMISGKASQPGWIEGGTKADVIMSYCAQLTKFEINNLPALIVRSKKFPEIVNILQT